MSRIWGIVVGLCAIVGVASMVFFFSGARGKVAKQNIENKIDDLLGKTKVEQQKLADAIEKANQGVEILFDARVREQVRVERLTKDLKPTQATYDAASAKLTEKLEALQKVKANADYEVTIEKTTYSQKNLEALQTLVVTQTNAVNTLKKTVEDKKADLTAAQKSLNLLSSQEKDGREKVALYEARYKALKSKMEALEKQQEAAKLLSAGKKSIANNFDEIDKSLSDLEDKAEVEFRKAEEQAAVQAAKALPPAKSGEDLDETIRKAEEALKQTGSK